MPGVVNPRGRKALALALAAAALLLPSGFAVAACTSRACGDARAVTNLRASLAAECRCGSTIGPKRYVRCVKSQIKSLVRRRQLPPACRKPILGCERDSTCGRPMAVACCETSGRGGGEGGIGPDAPPRRAKRRPGGPRRPPARPRGVHERRSMSL